MARSFGSFADDEDDLAYDDGDDGEEFGDGARRVGSGAEAVSTHLGQRDKGVWHVEYLIENSMVLVMLQTQNYASTCSHCGKEHYFMTIQQINAKEQRKGHGTRAVLEILDALPSAFKLRNGAELPMGLQIQSVMTAGSVALVKKLGMAPVALRMMGEFGDYHLCKHGQ